MYWMTEAVTGVEDAKLPQFTIVGYETTDRKEQLATGIVHQFNIMLTANAYLHEFAIFTSKNNIYNAIHSE